MTKSKNFLHPRSILTASNSQLESNFSSDASPQSSRSSARARSPRNRSPFAKFRRPSTLGYEQTVVSVLKLHQKCIFFKFTKFNFCVLKEHLIKNKK